MTKKFLYAYIKLEMVDLKGVILPVILVKIKKKAPLSELLQAIEGKISSQFFEGSYFLVEGDSVLTEEEVKELESFLSSKKIKNIKKASWETSSQAIEKERLLILQKHLRSGQRVEHHGDILILGDVNPDAEIVASGNIIVMGKLRGIAWAGAMGDESAIIIALGMEPQQLKIAGVLANLKREEKGIFSSPQVAKIKEGNIILESVK
ncbi:MAG: septum site-determining protein MinC [Thermodesulfobacteriaceae bacterium]|nr:septum site-determining protein MinC [Thermodesulfobacteriaceae bacterium]